ncbi:MAG: ATP-binding cassette domain-containing protein [Hydrogenibacillus sp.]|nr:ATP-binding cassette domain-containing protein [Hydrogenibacillus sp.]
MTDVVIEAKGVHARLGRAGRDVLAGASLAVRRGEWVTVVGDSGAGKTTLLYVLAGLLPKTAGEVRYEGTVLSSPQSIARHRARRMGLIFQGMYYIHSLTVRENVALPSLVADPSARRIGPAALERADRLLERVGLFAQKNALPHELSHGGRRRLAVARALFFDPPLILADEPTNDLDRDNVAIIHRLFDELKAKGTALIVVSHADLTTRRGDRTLLLADGRLEEIEPNRA